MRREREIERVSAGRGARVAEAASHLREVEQPRGDEERVRAALAISDVELARLGAAVVACIVVVFHQFAADHRRRAACREGGAGW